MATRKPGVNSRLAALRQAGFDRARYVGRARSGPAGTRGPAEYHVACSQCEALVINGVATHERGCPNQPRDGRETEDR